MCPSILRHSAKSERFSESPCCRYSPDELQAGPPALRGKDAAAGEALDWAQDQGLSVCLATLTITQRGSGSGVRNSSIRADLTGWKHLSAEGCFLDKGTADIENEILPVRCLESLHIL